MSLRSQAKEKCRWDLVSLGEIMLRFDPAIDASGQREASKCRGGGEYNVARGLKRCFGLDTAVVTAIADNPVGRLLEDPDPPGWSGPFAGPLGPLRRRRSQRSNGLNFTERGFGVRPALGCSDADIRPPRS